MSLLTFLAAMRFLGGVFVFGDTPPVFPLPVSGVASLSMSSSMMPGFGDVGIIPVLDCLILRVTMNIDMHFPSPFAAVYFPCMEVMACAVHYLNKTQ